MAKCKSCNDEDKKIKVSFCPKCKSTQIRHIFELRTLFGVMPKMKCKSCGNEMIVFPILVTTKKALEKSIKLNSKKNKNG